MGNSNERLFALWSARIRDSDEAAFQALFEATYPSLHRYAQSLTKNTVLAQDAVQEAFLRIWRRRATLDPSRSLRALLYLAVRNLVFNEERTLLQRKKLLATMDPPAAPSRPDEHSHVEMLEAHMRRWIRALPQRRREAFQLSRYDGLSYQEIAHVMGLSVKTVERHIQLALRELRDRLRALEPTLLQP